MSGYEKTTIDDTGNVGRKVIWTYDSDLKIKFSSQQSDVERTQYAWYPGLIKQLEVIRINSPDSANDDYSQIKVDTGDAYDKFCIPAQQTAEFLNLISGHNAGERRYLPVGVESEIKNLLADFLRPEKENGLYVRTDGMEPLPSERMEKYNKAPASLSVDPKKTGYCDVREG